MNRTKRACALLLALVLALGTVLQPGMTVYAAEPEQTTAATTEATTASTTAATTETTTETTTASTTEAATEAATETTEAATETTAATTETTAATTETTEATTETTAATTETTAATTETTAATTETTEATTETTEATTEATEETTEPTVSEELPPLYELLMASTTLAELEAAMEAEENAPALEELTQEELCALLARVGELYAAIQEPTEEDTLRKEALLERLNARIICPECGEKGGHKEGCSQYIREPYAWETLTEEEFAAWLLDEANAETVKAILQSEGEEYDALMARIDAILSGEDEELAQKVQEYLSVLMGIEAEVLADEYIYFDLAAGNVEIGGSTYSGKIFVKEDPDQPPSAKEVSGTRTGNERFYIYQSNTTDSSSVGYYTETGYDSLTDYDAKQNCHIPEYQRVSYNGELWADYIINKTDVEEVSKAWENAAAAIGRKALGVQGAAGTSSTGNYIRFKSEQNYKADVTIDNIWTYYQVSGATRDTGGITANLVANRDVHITLRLKGDNRFGNIHYGANKGTENTITFMNGEDEGAKPGSITVADFPTDFKKNYWCSAIGGDDNQCDRSDGIVIKSGVIYAGTTPQDNCTAIGGGGNEYGRVTIDGGTVTAVVSSTGTAIGGGIGYSEKGGDTEVTINGGTIYAYNLGIDKTLTGGFASFVPAAAIGGGGSNGSAGNLNATITITDGTVYAQSMGGPAIGGGGSANNAGGPATITIKGGDITAKSIPGSFDGTPVDAGVSIGGGTGATGGGSVTLNISGNPTIRTGSIGGGKATGEGAKIGNATVTIDGGDIMGQVIMAGTGDADKKCTFTMTAGKIHGTNVTPDRTDNRNFYYLEEDGGAVWMDDTIGETTISGGTIEGCTALRGGAIYMTSGTFKLSGGEICGNTAKKTADSENTGLGGGVVVDGNGTVVMNGGEIRGNNAENRGGGVYMPGGSFRMTGGKIDGNNASNGGGIFLTKSPTLTGGTISGNKATEHGGGVCINGGGLELAQPEMQIYGNRAQSGGGVAVRDGSFILSGGAVGVAPPAGTTPGAGGAANSAEKGGGVYVEGGSVTVNSGNIWYNSATEGGGVYLAKSEGDFTLEGETAVISHNEATNGGGVYLYKNPLLNQGRIEHNTATVNGGGMYIKDCLVELEPTGEVFITENTAQKDGGGIYIHGSLATGGTPASPAAATYDAVTGATGTLPEDAVGLLVPKGFTGKLHFTKNIATESGGAVCIEAADAKSRFELDSENITVTGNKAKNGGGVAVLHGNFTMTAGAIGESGKANDAINGGGVYVSNGEVWFKGGSIQYNEATDGGGAYVDEGKFVMINGYLVNNTATGNGGGAYVAGDFDMLDGTIGGDGGSNSAVNGGGVYVNEGNVTVVYGDISYNHASGDGGGFHVSANTKLVNVVMLSGNLSNNEAKVNGGGMAVESTSNQKITVEIGCLLDHKGTAATPAQPVIYSGDTYKKYNNFDGVDNQHESCPVVEHNTAGEIGGGFYMNSDASTLSFYCVKETNNIAKGSGTAGMDVEGGRVIIGDEHYHNSEYTAHPHNTPWGYISMDDATLVNGGQVDIYGDMDNPIFKKEVTVDIEDKDNDHFLDHRRAHTTKRGYKVHYIENFFGTGLYQAFQYDENNTMITIEGTLYNRPGYTILGWCTEKSKDVEGAKDYEVGQTYDLAKLGTADGMGTHSINCELCGVDEKDEKLLELYAIWEANGYTVVFDPNVPAGDTYTGTMENVTLTYGEKIKLPENKYEYPGHFFTKWKMTADNGTEKTFTDGEEVSNLTTKKGTVVTLYAQWEICDHKDPHRWTYEVKQEAPETLWRICSCGNQTLSATLSAEDTVYDGLAHPATLTLDDKEAWGTDAPVIEYTGEWLESDGIPHDPDTSPELTTDKKEPFHAGKYTAFIKKTSPAKLDPTDTTTVQKDVKASVTYTIAKADQDPPEKPTYDPPRTGSNDLTINRVKNDPRTFQDSANISHTAKVQYRLSYYSGDTLVGKEWQTIQGTGNSLDITMDTAWTSYYVEARYEELEDYKPSDIVRADAVYHFAGDVKVIIICDEGIDAHFQPETDADGNFAGAKLKLTTKPEYYVLGDAYRVSATLKTDDSADPKDHSIHQKEGTTDEYSVTGVKNNSTLTITIGKTRKKPVVEAKVEPRQIFTALTGTETNTTISRDSAFTAVYQVKNYDPGYEYEYAAEDGSDASCNIHKGLKLTFGSNIPAGTTIILVDRSTGGKDYWYYRAASDVTFVPLTEFTRMGGGGTYAIPNPAETPAGQPVGYVDLSYQFIVDFSQAAGGYTGGDLKMTLEATTVDGNPAQVPTPDNSSVTVSTVTPSFSLTDHSGTENSLTRNLNCNYTVDAPASKWENRASALILKPTTGTILPPDARIKAEVGGGTTYLYKSGGKFIVPMSLLQTETVNLTLQSDLFPADKTQYKFTAEWWISTSKAGKAPMSKDKVDTLTDVTFTSPAKTVPSLKTSGDYRVLTAQDKLNLTIETKNLDLNPYTVSAALLRKAEDGTYRETGWNKQNVGADNLEVSLGGQNPGSFCVMLTVKESGSPTIVLEVPYYFIIKPTQ